MIQIWRNSDLVMPYCRQYRPLSMKDMERWYDKLHEDKHYNLTNDLFLIKHEGEPIGVGGLVRIDYRNRKAEISFYFAYEMAPEIIKLALTSIIRYGFTTLNLRKLYFPCYSFNPRIPIYEEVMEAEYVAEEEYYYEGKYYDRIVLVKYA